MKKQVSLLAVALSFLVSLLAGAAGPVVVPLWPDGAPTRNGLEGQPESAVYDNPVNIGNVSVPELWIYPAKNPNGQAIVCAPGGAYRYVSSANEGKDMAQWMNGLGVTWAVLKYRMPNGHKEVPLEDGRRAMQIMREKASEYGFNPNEVGIMGHSAGGHFAANLATRYGAEAYRPDFQILVYPVVSMDPAITHKETCRNLLGENPTQEELAEYSCELKVDGNTPPAFIIFASDDRVVPAENSLRYAAALQKAGVTYSLHIYPNGGHGFGYGEWFPYKTQYKSELERWLRHLHDHR